MASSPLLAEFELEAHNLAQQARKLAEALEMRAHRLVERAYRYRSLADSIDQEDADSGMESEIHGVVERLLPETPSGAAFQRAVTVPSRRPAKHRLVGVSPRVSAADGKGDREKVHGRTGKGKPPRLEVLRTLATAVNGDQLFRKSGGVKFPSLGGFR